jgi:hypothetical protein
MFLIILLFQRCVTLAAIQAASGIDTTIALLSSGTTVDFSARAFHYYAWTTGFCDDG